jgi:hypothetical protein
MKAIIDAIKAGRSVTFRPAMIGTERNIPAVEVEVFKSRCDWNEIFYVTLKAIEESAIPVLEVHLEQTNKRMDAAAPQSAGSQPNATPSTE